MKYHYLTHTENNSVQDIVAILKHIWYKKSGKTTFSFARNSKATYCHLMRHKSKSRPPYPACPLKQVNGRSASDRRVRP